MMNEDIQNKFLEHSSPNVVYNWLEKNYNWLEKNASMLQKFSSTCPTVELALLQRNEPIIDLALALFSYNNETRNILFDRGDGTLQKAVLTNKRCGNFPALENLLKEENTEYLEILLTNTEDRSFLVRLFERTDPFEKVKENYWLILLEITARNKILNYPYSEDDPEWNDDEGFSRPARRLYLSVYGLFDTLTVNDKSANLLAQLMDRLPEVQDRSVVADPLKLIKKWQSKKKVEHSDYIYFHRWPWGNYGDDKEKFKECMVEQDYVNCRTHLANSYDWVSKEFKGFENSDDVALRLAYYSNEHFNLCKEKTSHLIKNWNKYRIKDGNLFFKYLIKNISIYYNKEIREHIDENGWLITNGVDEYQERLKKLKEINPEEFIDNSQLEKIVNIESELFLLRNDLRSIIQETEKNRQFILSQRAISIFMISLLVVFILISWL